MKISSVIFILICLFSCHSHPIKQITLDVESTVNDDVQVFVNETYTQGYTEESSIKKPIQVGKNRVTFNLDTFKDIKAIRIDLGDATKPRKLCLNQMSISDGKSTEVLSNGKLSLFFEGNDEVIFNKEQQAFELKNSQVEDPFIISKNLDKLF